MKHTTESPPSGPVTILADGHGGYRENETYFWGGDWLTRFAACFSRPPEDTANPAGEKLAVIVDRAIATLPENERQIIIDYYVSCFPRRVIALRQGMTEQEVDATRARAERRLRSMLVEFVEQRFGRQVADLPTCPLCASADREQIDRRLDRHQPEQSWATLRRQINSQFGLQIKRVQTVMTHWRYHRTPVLPTADKMESTK